MVDCKKCNGTGKIQKTIQTPFGKMESRSICPDCLEERQIAIKKEMELEEQRKRKEIEEKGSLIRERSYTIIQRFFEVTERKVSITDDYGDENRGELKNQIEIVTEKIAVKEGYYEDQINNRKKDTTNTPSEIDFLKEKLKREFILYHASQKNPDAKDEEINKMSGIDFELFISKQLKYLGYETIHTPKTGDQGADLIIKKENKTYIIQAKRYEGSVGNKAVQEVVGAVNFYGGDQGYVITNSLFTQSAKALAQKNKIILIDGHDLKNIENFF